MRAAATPGSKSQPVRVALTVAGSDSGAGAGIQADLLTFSNHGVFGTTAITCLTAQNPGAVSGVHAAPAEFVREQIEAVCSFFPVKAAKTGMLFDAGIVAEVAAAFTRRHRISLVVDPVMVATSGAVLLREDAIAALTQALFPLAMVITPNLDETAVLLGARPAGFDELRDAASTLSRRYGTSVLLKGGHLPGNELIDVLAQPRGRMISYRSRRIGGVDTHGSGCTLSAAITANLATGRSLEDAVAAARRYLRRGMMRPLHAAGRRFIAH